jgi:GNAT superfamily N-acetyltransferase
VSLRVFTARERPDLGERGRETSAVWPEYNVHSPVSARYWGRLLSELPDHQFVLYDEAADDVVAQGHSAPLVWDGSAEGLPAGFDAVLPAAFGLLERGAAPTALCALAVQIPERHQGRGHSAAMLGAMAAIAARHGLDALIAPVRPSQKERYPLVPIERYAAWQRSDGLPFDAWMRVHARLGATILRSEPRSLMIPGTVAEWESWTALRFPESGEYWFPRGLATVHIDVEADRGVYWEPNVWMVHGVS